MSKQPCVVWITSGFPYGRGEQFIETEVPYWEKFPGRVILLPENAADADARPVPPGVEVDTRLMDRWHERADQLRGLARAIASPWLWREVMDLKGLGYTKYRLQHALLTAVRMSMELRALKEIERDLGQPIDVVYTYWMSVGTWAASLAKRAGYVRRVISRAHRSEFYDYARPAGYTAFVPQFAPDLDALAVISDDAKEHAPRYGFRPEQLKVARLGVVPGPASRPTAADELSLLSVSTLTPVKRVNLMIDAIAEAARRLPEVRFTWRHAGDGPLKDEIHAQAKSALGPLQNVNYDFLGHINNSDLLALYGTTPVDLLLNSSESEGVPVSIMEAMMREVPTIATDAGATKEVLLPELLVPIEGADRAMADKIVEYHLRAKNPAFRAKARERAESRYSAATNYAAFVDLVTDLATKP